ncbi:hypothetical protein AWC38_SpisGene5964 [Stylophora pistillata]|uniref:Uncharacterized protein n=1 Tax=Stylophora pistillata TaxID=50429 RepID=A0A2B4SL55_STYPI|nr:hypothetical protein AWC38_SpisGene5964 [Stylophora pistillata]
MGEGARGMEEQSIEIDRRKEEEKKDSLIQQDQEKEKHERETARLEAVRSSRSWRVPAEPAVGAPRVGIRVPHVTSGNLVHYFSSSDKMLRVYDWIGSLAKEPENFKLCSSPEVVAMPCDPVSNCTLYIQVTDESILSLEDSDVMFKGYGSEQRKPENLYGGIQLQSASTPPDFLVLGDECLVADHHEGELIKKTTLSFLSQSDGDSQHSIPILPNLNQEDYVRIGRILTHQFVLCDVGMWAMKLDPILLKPTFAFLFCFGRLEKHSVRRAVTSIVSLRTQSYYLYPAYPT